MGRDMVKVAGRGILWKLPFDFWVKSFIILCKRPVKGRILFRIKEYK